MFMILYGESEFSTISNFAPQDFGIIPDTIGKGQTVVGHTKDEQQYCVWKDGVITLLGEHADAQGSKKIWIAHLENDDELIVSGKEMWTNVKDAEGEPTGNYLRQNLDDLVDPDSGWIDLDADAVSDNGYITGKGKFNGETKRFLLLKVDIVPDYNRDGIIDELDRGKVTESNPYRFWVNDDDDRSGGRTLMAVTHLWETI